MSTATRDTPSTSTPEYIAFQQCYEALVLHIKLQPGAFCDSLFARRYISESVRDYTRNESNLDQKKAEKLIDSVIDGIKYDSNVFHGFIKILKTHCLDKLAERLQQYYEDYKSEGERKHKVCKRAQRSDDFCDHKVHDLNAEDMEKPGQAGATISHPIDYHSSTESDSTSPKQKVLKSDSSLATTKPGIASTKLRESSETQDPNHSSFFVCKYCGMCTLEQFFSRQGCFSTLQQVSSEKKVLFPYLDMASLDEADRTDLEDQLQTETQEIILHFAKLTSDVKKSLQSLEIPLDEIKHSILSLEAFTYNLAVKVLDEEDKQEIKKAKTLSEVFIILCNYISFFNYQIIEYIIGIHGSEKDHERLKDYLQAFHNFCKRSIFEVPQHVLSFSSRRTSKVLVFKFIEAGNDRLHEIEGVKGKIAKIFQLRSSALQLCSVRKGCIELHFMISTAVADYIFPVSPSQFSALSEVGVKVLSCERVEQISREPQERVHGISSDCTSDNAKAKITSLSAQLVDASKRGSISEVSSLIEQGANVDFCDEDGHTGLWLASYSGHTKCLEMLTDARAMVDVQDKGGRTAIHAACVNGYDKAVKVLLKVGADLNIPDNDGRSVLWMTSYSGQIKCLDMLTNAGATVDVLDKYRQTAVHAACVKGHHEVIKFLVEAGANLDIQNMDGRTALHFASYSGHMSCVELLTNAGSALNVQDKKGQTALCAASWKGHDKVVQTLIQAGVDLNIQDHNGCTALQLACLNGFIKCAELLTKAGAAIDMQEKYGQTAFQAACSRGHYELVKMLLQAGAGLNIQDNDGLTALRFASQNGYVKCVIELTNAGAAVDVKDKLGQTAFQAACWRGHVEIVKILLQAGADPNAQDNDDHTALQFASFNGQVNCVEILTTCGARVNVQDKAGRTALIAACRGGHDEVVRILLQAGANVNVQDNVGRTALRIAHYNHQSKCFNLLTNAGALMDVPDKDITTGGNLRLIDPIDIITTGGKASDELFSFIQNSPRARSESPCSSLGE